MFSKRQPTSSNCGHSGKPFLASVFIALLSWLWLGRGCRLCFGVGVLLALFMIVVPSAQHAQANSISSLLSDQDRDSFMITLLADNSLDHSVIINPERRPEQSEQSEQSGSGLGDTQVNETPPNIKNAFPENMASLAVLERKKVFINTVLPLIQRANAEVCFDRLQLLSLHKAIVEKEPLTPEMLTMLQRLSARYKVSTLSRKLDSQNPSPPDDTFLQEAIEKFQSRVDILPVAIILAQSAVESGWGASRFSREGNALFGEWTTDKTQGMMPRGVSANSEYRVRRFSSLQHSVRSYLNNINTHRAYRKLRATREQLVSLCSRVSDRQDVQSMVDKILPHLSAYARSKDYVVLLKKLIKQEDLIQHDLP